VFKKVARLWMSQAYISRGRKHMCTDGGGCCAVLGRACQLTDRQTCRKKDIAIVYRPRLCAGEVLTNLALESQF